jgi:hypothetical protein
VRIPSRKQRKLPVASHDISQMDYFAGQAALGGFSLFGKPLIYAIFAVTLAELAVGDETAATGSEERGPDKQRTEV